MSIENKSDSKQTKDEKCPANKKLYSPTIRLTITLREPDEDSCSVFNYLSLLAEEVSLFSNINSNINSSLIRNS